MKNILVLTLLTCISLMFSVHVFSQSESVLVVAKKGSREFVINVVNPDDLETYVRYNFKDYSYAVMLKKELDNWIREGFKIVDSSTSYSSDETGSTHEVVYVLVKESSIKIKHSSDN